MTPRCEKGEGSKFLVVKTDGSSVSDNFSSLGCSKQYKEHFKKTSNTCGVNNQGEIVEVKYRWIDCLRYGRIFESCLTE